MTVRYEWMGARTATTEVVAAGCELGVNVVDAPLALLIACDEVTVIEGSGNELQTLLTCALEQVRAATGGENS